MARTAKKRPSPPHFLKEWRDERSLTQEQIGERIKADHSIVGRIENGRIKLNEKRILSLAVALRLPNPGDLFRSPKDQVWSLASRIAALSGEQREILERAIGPEDRTAQ